MTTPLKQKLRFSSAITPSPSRLSWVSRPMAVDMGSGPWAIRAAELRLAGIVGVGMDRGEVADQAGEDIDVALADRAAGGERKRLADLELLDISAHRSSPRSFSRSGTPKSG